MNRNIIKLLILMGVATCSWQTAGTYINNLVLEIESRPPSLSDVIIKQQVQETLKEADKEIARVEEEEKITIKQEQVQIKPAEPPKPEKPEKPTKPKEEVVIADETKEPELTETTTSSGVDVTDPNATLEQLDLAVYMSLTTEESTFLINYLIDHYFLYGYDYYSVETDPIRYARKKLANDMENYMIDSISGLTSLGTNLMSMSTKDLEPMVEHTLALRDEFKINFENVSQEQPDFAPIYQAGLVYFETYCEGLEKTLNVFKTVETASNKALVLPILLKGINQDLMPAIRDILNQSFVLKELTNQIYIEGVEADFLLSQSDVIKIISDPFLVLPPRPVEDATVPKE